MSTHERPKRQLMLALEDARTLQGLPDPICQTRGSSVHLTDEPKDSLEPYYGGH